MLLLPTDCQCDTWFPILICRKYILSWWTFITCVSLQKICWNKWFQDFNTSVLPDQLFVPKDISSARACQPCYWLLLALGFHWSSAWAAFVTPHTAKPGYSLHFQAYGDAPQAMQPVPDHRIADMRGRCRVHRQWWTPQDRQALHKALGAT